MKALLLLVTVLLAVFAKNFGNISRVNQYVSAAQEAYTRRDFTSAIFYYQYLLDSLQIRDRAVRLNLAHAYFRGNIPLKAFQYYRPLATKTSPVMASQVNVQLGILVANNDKTQALIYFKKALVLNSLNEEARYNYELLKKYLLQHPEETADNIPPPATSEPSKQKEEAKTNGKKENPGGEAKAEVPDLDKLDPANPALPNPSQGHQPGNIPPSEKKKDNQPAENKKQEKPAGDKPGESKGQQNEAGGNNFSNRKPQGGREESNDLDKARQTTFERLREANLSPERARMLLEAMREAEIQYLQQIPRQNTRKPDPSRPTW